MANQVNSSVKSSSIGELAFLPLISKKITSLEELRPYMGKVVKYTKDHGKTWNYFLLSKYVYSAPSMNGSRIQMEPAGVECFSELELWNNRLVGARVLFTKDSFVQGSYVNNSIDSGRFGKIEYYPESYFETASYEEFSNRAFQDVTVGEEHASRTCIHYDPRISIQEAPLTIVRSEKPAKLAVSVLFHLPKFEPRDPIVPKPSDIDSRTCDYCETEGKRGQRITTYTWDVQSHEDGSISVLRKNRLPERVKMIWWESNRSVACTGIKGLHIDPVPLRVDPAKSVCVKREDLKEFLKASLQKMGVQDNELEAFTHYWSESFKDETNAPYVLVQLTNKKEQDDLLPKMEVKSDEAAFDLKRFYFLFEPADQNNRGMDSKTYLENLEPATLSKNVVIDLGGEVVHSPDVPQKNPSSDSTEFVERFIKEHIYFTKDSFVQGSYVNNNIDSGRFGEIEYPVKPAFFSKA